MQFKNYIQSKLPFFIALSFSFVLASCGSYQYVGNDSDGIYSSEKNIAQEEETYVEAEPASSNSYYNNYFGEKAEQYDAVPEEDIIFTDIDSYAGDYDEENQNADYDAGWGQNSSDITISVYPNFGYNNFGWNRFGVGWYNAYWGYPYYGWNNFGWNNFGWGYSNFYANYWCPPFYAYGYGYPYYSNYGFNNHYRRGIAYNAGRRGNVNALNNRSTVNRRNSSSIRRSTSNTTRPRTNTTRRNNNSSTRSIRSNTPTRRNSSTRSTTTRRSSGSSQSVRSGSSRSSSRGSSVRSSSSRSRSSGTSSSRSSRRR